MITTRLATPTDADVIAELFHNTVRTINRRDYSSAQVEAWAPEDRHFRTWATHNDQRYTVVAVNPETTPETIVGFVEFEFQGHIDCFFCHKDYQNQGIGRLLYQQVEIAARRLKCSRLWTEASVTAQPFFLSLGFRVIQPQTVFVRGESFLNYQMEKSLDMA